MSCSKGRVVHEPGLAAGKQSPHRERKNFFGKRSNQEHVTNSDVLSVLWNSTMRQESQSKPFLSSIQRGKNMEKTTLPNRLRQLNTNWPPTPIQRRLQELEATFCDGKQGFLSWSEPCPWPKLKRETVCFHL